MYNSITPIVRPVFFVHLAFDSDPLFANTTPNNLEWNGSTWLGLGVLAEISPTDQNIEMSSSQLTIGLAGVPVEKLSEAKAHKYRSRRGYIYQGLFDENWVLFGTPLQIYGGELGSMYITASGETASITVTVDSPLADWERARTYRYTNEMQQDAYPGDLGLEYVAQQKNVQLTWGAK